MNSAENCLRAARAELAELESHTLSEHSAYEEEFGQGIKAALDRLPVSPQ